MLLLLHPTKKESPEFIHQTFFVHSVVVVEVTT